MYRILICDDQPDIVSAYPLSLFQPGKATYSIANKTGFLWECAEGVRTAIKLSAKLTEGLAFITLPPSFSYENATSL